MKKTECFKIQIVETDDLFDIEKGKKVKQIDFDRFNFLKEPRTIQADPFLFVKDDTLYLFYEDKKMYSPGVISMISTKNLINWTEPTIVLQENFHLSYPWVFEYNKKIYMIPETSEDGTIRLYKSENMNLEKFEYVSTLLKNDRNNLNINYSDSSIFLKDNYFYLMTTTNESLENNLELYIGDNLLGPYIVHPCSPIVKGNKFGRNAGHIIELDNKVYRVAQDCVKKYGEDVHLLEIIKMDQYDYIEKVEQENLLAKKTSFYEYGGHHFNFVKFKDKYIVATDAKEYKWMLLPKVLNKIRRYI